MGKINENATPSGYRRGDPDETLGRWLSRQKAEADARRSLALGRKVRLKPAQEGGGE